jgi:hypothetical protein
VRGFIFSGHKKEDVQRSYSIGLPTSAAKTTLMDDAPERENDDGCFVSEDASQILAPGTGVISSLQDTPTEVSPVSVTLPSGVTPFSLPPPKLPEFSSNNVTNDNHNHGKKSSPPSSPLSSSSSVIFTPANLDISQERSVHSEINQKIEVEDVLEVDSQPSLHIPKAEISNFITSSPTQKICDPSLSPSIVSLTRPVPVSFSNSPLRPSDSPGHAEIGLNLSGNSHQIPQLPQQKQSHSHQSEQSQKDNQISVIKERDLSKTPSSSNSPLLFNSPTQIESFIGKSSPGPSPVFLGSPAMRPADFSLSLSRTTPLSQSLHTQKSETEHDGIAVISLPDSAKPEHSNKVVKSSPQTQNAQLHPQPQPQPQPTIHSVEHRDDWIFICCSVGDCKAFFLHRNAEKVITSVEEVTQFSRLYGTPENSPSPSVASSGSNKSKSSKEKEQDDKCCVKTSISSTPLKVC